MRMHDIDPYNVTYPLVEHRCWTDVFPGMTFCFRDRTDVDTVWTVIVRVSVHPHNRDDCQSYLLLGSNGALTWHRGSLGGIRRLADPACELRLERWRRKAREEESLTLLADTAAVLGA